MAASKSVIIFVVLAVVVVSVAVAVAVPVVVVLVAACLFATRMNIAQVAALRLRRWLFGFGPALSAPRRAAAPRGDHLSRPRGQLLFLAPPHRHRHRQCQRYPHPRCLFVL